MHWIARRALPHMVTIKQNKNDLLLKYAKEGNEMFVRSLLKVGADPATIDEVKH